MLGEIQKKKLLHFFNVMDANHNRVLQPDDFAHVATKISDILEHPKDSRLRLGLQVRSYRLFIQLLTDLGKEQTTLNLEEWMSLFDRILNGESTFIKNYVNRTAAYIFSMFDQNNDGYISIDEYRDMFTVYNIDMKYLSLGFGKLDANNDGKISKDELIEGFSDFFLSPSTDAPGNWIFGDWN
jgi:hypothetical protein